MRFKQWLSLTVLILLASAMIVPLLMQTAGVVTGSLLRLAS